MKSKKLLIISSAFPPCGGPGVKRTLKLIKFFPETGWQPIVLTEKDGVFTLYDYSLLDEIPASVNIWRTKNFYSGLFRILKQRSGKKKAKPRNSIQNIRNKKNNTFSKLKELLIIPDGHIFWLPSAILKGLKLIRKENIKGIYATGDPFSNHIIGSLLKKITKLPLMLDFRDAWIADPAVKRTKPRDFIERKLEKYCVKSADKVVSVTEGVTEDFKKRYSSFGNHEKFITITNGFDREDIQSWQSSGIPGIDSTDENKLTIVHTGRLMGERTPKYFLKALRRALDEGVLEKEIEAIFVGDNIQFNDGRCIEDYIEEYNLENCVRLLGFLPRKRSMWYQFKADILLLIIGIVDKTQVNLYGLAGKVYDYILAEKPILVVGDPGGPAQELVRKTNVGEIFQSMDVDGIKDYIIDSVQKRRKSLRSRMKRTSIDNFDMRHLTARMANALNEMIGE